MPQIKEHFQFVFHQIGKILVSSKKATFDEKVYNQMTNEKANEKAKVAYAFNWKCLKINNKKNHQNIKNWVQDNQEYFDDYFTSRANDSKWIENEFGISNSTKFQNFLYCIAYFDLALSFNIKSQKMLECLNFILKQEEKKVPFSLFLKLNLLKVTKKHLKVYEIIEKYFCDKFNDYFLLLKNETPQFWENVDNSQDGGITGKLILANALKNLNPKDWQEKKWVETAFQTYKSSFKIPTPPNTLQDQKNWTGKLCDKIIELYLWQGLKFEKISLFNEIFSEDHLKIFKNCICDQDKPEDLALPVSMLFHKSLAPAVKQWVKNLKQAQGDKLIQSLMQISTIEILFF